MERCKPLGSLNSFPSPQLSGANPVSLLILLLAFPQLLSNHRGGWQRPLDQCWEPSFTFGGQKSLMPVTFLVYRCGRRCFHFTAAITKYRRLRSLNNRIEFCHSPGGCKSQIEVSAEPSSLWRLQGEDSSCFFQPLVVPDFPWVVATSPQSQSLSSCGLLLCVGLPVSSPHPIKMPVCRFRAQPKSRIPSWAP